MCRLPRSTLFPYTTLFRSDDMTVPWRREFTREELEKELEHDYSTSKSGIVPLGERRSLYHFVAIWVTRSEEHTSELQSHSDLVCRLLLEKKKSAKSHESDA